MNKKEFNYRAEDKALRFDDFLYKYEWMLDSERNKLNDIYYYRFRDDEDDEQVMMFLELEYSYFPRLNKPFPFKGDK